MKSHKGMKRQHRGMKRRIVKKKMSRIDRAIVQFDKARARHQSSKHPEVKRALRELGNAQRSNP